METLEEVLRSVVEGIGYKAARAKQRRVILSFLQGKDVFFSLSDIDIPAVIAFLQNKGVRRVCPDALFF